MLVFACFSPHPPIILPEVGSPTDREKVKKTIKALGRLSTELAEVKPEVIIITSPHPDWGINVPAHFLLANLKFSIYNFQSISNFKFSNLNFNENFKLKTKNSTPILPFLTSLNSPQQHFDFGQQIIRQIPNKIKVGWIASGDMSHRLREDGPYGFHPAGPKFDKKFIELLKKKDISGILDLDLDLVEEAGECGLRSFCLLLGALEWQSRSAGLKPRLAWQPEILSYEGPFGVGYLVAHLKLETTN